MAGGEQESRDQSGEMKQLAIQYKKQEFLSVSAPSSVILRVPPLDSETGWTGELFLSQNMTVFTPHRRRRRIYFLCNTILQNFYKYIESMVVKLEIEI